MNWVYWQVDNRNPFESWIDGFRIVGFVRAFDRGDDPREGLFLFLRLFSHRRWKPCIVKMHTLHDLLCELVIQMRREIDLRDKSSKYVGIYWWHLKTLASAFLSCQESWELNLRAERDRLGFSLACVRDQGEGWLATGNGGFVHFIDFLILKSHSCILVFLNFFRSRITNLNVGTFPYVLVNVRSIMIGIYLCSFSKKI